jgi:hypothetical protein
MSETRWNGNFLAEVVHGRYLLWLRSLRTNLIKVRRGQGSFVASKIDQLPEPRTAGESEQHVRRVESLLEQATFDHRWSDRMRNKCSVWAQTLRSAHSRSVSEE